MKPGDRDSRPSPVPDRAPRVPMPEVGLDEIRALVGRQLGIESVRAEDHLVEDLGAESADVLNLVLALEDRYGVVIQEEEVPQLETVADVWKLVRRRVT